MPLIVLDDGYGSAASLKNTTNESSSSIEESEGLNTDNRRARLDIDNLTLISSVEALANIAEEKSDEEIQKLDSTLIEHENEVTSQIVDLEVSVSLSQVKPDLDKNVIVLTDSCSSESETLDEVRQSDLDTVQEEEEKMSDSDQETSSTWTTYHTVFKETRPTIFHSKLKRSSVQALDEHEDFLIPATYNSNGSCFILFILQN